MSFRSIPITNLLLLFHTPTRRRKWSGVGGQELSHTRDLSEAGNRILILYEYGRDS